MTLRGEDGELVLQSDKDTPAMGRGDRQCSAYFFHSADGHLGALRLEAAKTPIRVQRLGKGREHRSGFTGRASDPRQADTTLRTGEPCGASRFPQNAFTYD